MKTRKDIWTIELNDIVNEEGINHRLCAGIYEDMDSAIETAIEVVKEFAGDDRVLEATVYQGEYMTESGDVFGEPYEIFTATNVSKEKSSATRKEAGYVKPYVDYYAVEGNTANNISNI